MKPPGLCVTFRRICKVAALSLLIGRPGPASADVLGVDFNKRADKPAAVTEAGFESFILDNIGGDAEPQEDPVTRSYGAISVTVEPAGGGTIDDRNRGAPANAEAFTEEKLLQDFIFSPETEGAEETGIRVVVSGLIAGRSYPVSVWSFDAGSSYHRSANWKANGNPVKHRYTFNGNFAPASNSTYRFDFAAIADGAGKIRIEGFRDHNSLDAELLPAPGVFLNALRIGDPFTDADGDWMDDAWEGLHGLNPAANDAAGDKDGDGLTNLIEFLTGTLPDEADTDGDGFADGRETRDGSWSGPNSTGTDPLDPDSDDDGLADGFEDLSKSYAGPWQPGTDPNLADSDGDLFSDKDELLLLTNPDDSTSHAADSGTLAIDFGEDDTAVSPPEELELPTPVQFHWEGLTGIQNWAGTFFPPASPGGITVAITPAGSVTLDDRDRGPLNGGSFYYKNLYRDFVFAQNSDAEADGMDITITGLLPNTGYPVILVMFDRESAGRSRWLANDGGGQFVWKAENSFDGPAAPMAISLTDYGVRFVFVTDHNGRIVIQGRAAAGATAASNVFLNAMLIREPLAPMAITLVRISPATGDLTLTWQSVPKAPYLIEKSADLSAWTSASETVYGSAGEGETTEILATESLPAGRGWFRVRRTDL